MPSANTSPEVIVDKNGKKTTVHKKVDTAKTSNRGAKLGAIKPTAVAAVASDGIRDMQFSDDVFGFGASISDGQVNASVTLSASNLGFDNEAEAEAFVRENYSDIKEYLVSQYEAEGVEETFGGEIVVDYSVPYVEGTDSEGVLDALYETRGPSLHEDARKSTRFADDLRDWINSTDTADFEPNRYAYTFDDGTTA